MGISFSNLGVFLLQFFLGGMIAIELALHNLDRILSLSLAVTHCGGYSSMAPVCAFKSLFLFYFSH